MFCAVSGFSCFGAGRAQCLLLAKHTLYYRATPYSPLKIITSCLSFFFVVSRILGLFFALLYLWLHAFLSHYSYSIDT